MIEYNSMSISSVQKREKPIKWLYKKAKKQRFKIWLLVFANIIFSVLSVAFAFAIRHIVNGATIDTSVFTKEEGTKMIIDGSIAIGVIVLLQALFRIIIGSLTEHIAGRLDITFKSDLFATILSRKYSAINAYHSGELLNRLTSDVKIVSDGIVNVLPTAIAAITRLLCAVAALIILEPVFAIGFTVAGALVFLTIAIMRGKLKGLHKSAQTKDGVARSFMQECIENLLAVKTFSVNEQINQKATALQEDSFRVKMKRKNYAVGGHTIYNFIFSAGYVFALIFGGIKILNGEIFYGDLSAILQLVNNVQVPFASLSNLLPTYYSMIASAERLMEIEEIETETSDETKLPEQVISESENMQSIVIDNVTFSYGRDNVLQNASLKVNRGDFIAVLGRSGIGKSTILKLLLGVYNVKEGQVYLDNGNEKKPLDVYSRTIFSYVPQGNLLFSGTLKDNVAFIKADATDIEIENALKTSCAYDFVNQLPDGLNTVVGENGAGLSEGQIQRIAIARALLCGAPVILLDEATSALDDITEKQLLSNLKGLKDVTVIIVSHRKQVLDVCNRAVAVKNKRIEEIAV